MNQAVISDMVIVYHYGSIANTDMASQYRTMNMYGDRIMDPNKALLRNGH